MEVAETSRADPPAAVVQDVPVAAPLPPDERPVAPAPVFETPVAPMPVVAGPAPVAEPAVATRYCPRCGDRVPLGVDGLSCHVGHRLSGVHREPKRRWFRRRRSY